jgi:hypothetical protein
MMTAAIRPIQFSALNVLDRLDEEEEQDEENHRREDGPKIVHHNSQSFDRAWRTSPTRTIKAPAAT